MADNCVLAWHFASSQMRDGTQLAAPGGVERYDGRLYMCCSGLHASRRLLDELKYAPGALLRRVECVDSVESHDKLVCYERRVLWECDMTAALRLFARRCAFDVAHLWRNPMPDVVREFLMTGHNAAAASAAAEEAEAAAWAEEAAAWAEAAASASASAAAWAAASAAWASASAEAAASASAAAWAAAWAAAEEAAASASAEMKANQERRLAAYAQAARAGAFYQ